MLRGPLAFSSLAMLLVYTRIFSLAALPTETVGMLMMASPEWIPPTLIKGCETLDLGDLLGDHSQVRDIHQQLAHPLKRSQDFGRADAVPGGIGIGKTITMATDSGNLEVLFFGVDLSSANSLS